MEVNDPNKSNALCSSYEHVLADEKKIWIQRKWQEKRREEERNSVVLNQHGMNQKTVHLSV